MRAFVPNANFDLMADDEVRANLTRLMEPVRQQVVAVAPVHTRRYARSIVVVEIDGRVYLGSTDPFAHLVEWGSVNNPAYAPLRRGVQNAGMRLEET